MTRSKVLRLALVLLVFGALGVLANFLLAPEQVKDLSVAATAGNAAQSVPVTLAAAQRGRIERVLVLSGTLEAQRTVAVASKAGGTVERVLADKGDVVRRGQALVVLDTRNLVLSAEQARADRDAARASLDELKRGARTEEVSQAEAARQKAAKQLDTDRANLERANKLHAEGVVSDSYLEQAQTRHEDSTVELRMAEDRLKILKDGATAEQLARAEAVLAGAQARAALAEQALEDATLASPADGVIAERRIQPGEFLAAGQPAFILHEEGLKVTASVPERVAPALRVGQTATLELPGTGKVQAAITMISPALDPTSRTLAVEIALHDPGPDIFSGGFVRVTLVPEVREGALTVPSDAVVSGEGSDYLFVASEGRAVRREVRTGIRSDAAVEILGGLADGEQVVVEGAGRVKDGSLLRVLTR